MRTFVHESKSQRPSAADPESEERLRSIALHCTCYRAYSRKEDAVALFGLNRFDSHLTEIHTESRVTPQVEDTDAMGCPKSAEMKRCEA